MRVQDRDGGRCRPLQVGRAAERRGTGARRWTRVTAMLGKSERAGFVATLAPAAGGSFMPKTRVSSRPAQAPSATSRRRAAFVNGRWLTPVLRRAHPKRDAVQCSTASPLERSFMPAHDARTGRQMKPERRGGPLDPRADATVQKCLASRLKEGSRQRERTFEAVQFEECARDERPAVERVAVPTCLELNPPYRHNPSCGSSRQDHNPRPRCIRRRIRPPDHRPDRLMGTSQPCCKELRTRREPNYSALPLLRNARR
jgi:hypothetical protein